jgi:hypothetical protein
MFRTLPYKILFPEGYAEEDNQELLSSSADFFSPGKLPREIFSVIFPNCMMCLQRMINVSHPRL